MSFELELGLASRAGRHGLNEDFAGVQQAPAQTPERGWVAALADGVSRGGAGAMAAQTTVLGLLDDFPATPPEWDAHVALDRLLQAQNRWLVAHNRRAGDAEQGLTTLTAVVLQGNRYALSHVGDSRAWLLRDGSCQLLTLDHRLPRADFAGLTRALGLDDQLRLDHSQGELRRGDRLLLTSDGVHGPLGPRDLARLLAEAPGAQAAAQALVDAAQAAGGADDATALVIAVQGLATPGLDDLQLLAAQLPTPERLDVGRVLDGYTITARVADNGVRRLVQARDGRTGALVALKALHPSRQEDAAERAMLAHELWLGERLAEAARARRGLRSRYDAALVRVWRPSEPSAFYGVFEWHAGRTLEQLLAEGPQPADLVQALALAVAGALSLLHAAGCVHRDIKPANLHLGEDGCWRLLDLGVALSPRAPAALRALAAGTPAYMNPEQWADPAQLPDAGSDLFALGVTLYRALTGRLPYGEVQPYQRAAFRREPAAVGRFAPQTPMWLAQIVNRLVTRERRERFESADELRLALERGAVRGLPAPRALPLLRRDSGRLWQLGLAVSVLVNLLLLAWLLWLPTR
ncbi:MAG: serine/threonine protein phosphatase [Roseateles depolymerans]|uniref:Serine/threonine protein phosphatase n=1 Tax=Roseateles depolymerans TaxID=76731 RepID=A0A2W5DGF6_9BURK|nr:MAG: serine/threonine protein phosphatase [Roseateles depolymerans]